ncbi:glycoside hydrolase family 3 protein [Marinilactibacillus kalidii]|uniref:glycoside hydrolase family 3 protein n=1 Tax=Marinilactibacillus kalidii TaxID=2820274 RepID=UPI001ABEC2EE|nr:glycoside hydrolase family 3 protein [Marinilactibacillus kalidii]
MKNKKIPAILLYILNIALIIALIVGYYYANKYSQIITTSLGHETTKITSSDENESAEYYESDYESEEAQVEHSEEVVKEVASEGIVLVKNENEALPLDASSNISIFGQNSVDFVYGGEGASSVDKSKAVSFMDALDTSGFETNPTLTEFYTDGPGSSFRKSKPDLYGEGEFAVNEVPASEYTDEVIDSFEDYNDAAVVVIGRSGGESADISTEVLDSGSRYLELDQDEIDMINLADENFDSVIVVLNTVNPMELEALESDAVDAVVWTGAVGQTGTLAIADVLNGTTNPSGRFTDTYAYDVMSAPAMVNYGNFSIENTSVEGANGYMVYSEGIYIGYRYYETRYADFVRGVENVGEFDYSEAVQYPFGYGTSYSAFSYSDYTMSEEDDEYVFEIEVTNDGDTEGKDVVQLYMQSPYTDYDKENLIEKPVVELVGYAKTELLSPQETATVTINVSKESMKVYDANGFETYIVDAGDYQFAVGENAHDAVNNILASEGYTEEDGMTEAGNEDMVQTITIDEMDSETYASSVATSNPITNQFEAVDMQKYDESLTYLSRNDWEGTWPEVYAGGELEASDAFLEDLKVDRTPQEEVTEMPTLGTIDEELGKVSAIHLKDLEFNDPLWDSLLDQLTVEEMLELVRMGGYATVPISSINLPGTVIRDGTAGISGELAGGEIEATAFPVQVVVGSTWNDTLVEEMGRAVGEDSLKNNVAGWYAPGMNLHRVPFGGRNFEYFSEDSLLSGKMSSSIIRGAKEKGAFTHAKHFVLNDTDTNRINGSMFANEQSLRDLYFAPFEISVREGNANGFMASMNRIGTTWSGANYSLMTETLRNEWGFEGLVATDQASFINFAYQDIVAGLDAGTNLWLNTDSELWHIDDEDLTANVVNNLRASTHSILYTIVNSNAMNGIAQDDEVVKITPLWRYWLWAATAVVAIFILWTTYWATKRIKSSNQKDSE